MFSARAANAEAKVLDRAGNRYNCLISIPALFVSSASEHLVESSVFQPHTNGSIVLF